MGGKMVEYGKRKGRGEERKGIRVGGKLSSGAAGDGRPCPQAKSLPLLIP